MGRPIQQEMRAAAFLGCLVLVAALAAAAPESGEWYDTLASNLDTSNAAPTLTRKTTETASQTNVLPIEDVADGLLDALQSSSQDLGEGIGSATTTNSILCCSDNVCTATPQQEIAGELDPPSCIGGTDCGGVGEGQAC